MTFGSLFSGIGGIDLGLERAGMDCCWQVEIDPFCTRVLEKHWPGVKRYGDIRHITGGELEPVDLIAGGFPCQDLSQAGKRAGIEGSRSGLWFEFARLVRSIRPRYVLAENVPGLLVPGAMDRVVGELAGLGYVGCWLSLRASDFGASHLRKRVFIVADSGDRFVQKPRWGSERRDGLGSAGETLWRFAPGPSDPRWSAILAECPDLAPAIESKVRGVADGISEEMDGAMKGRTKRLKPLGNAVVPDCAEWIGRRLQEANSCS